MGSLTSRPDVPTQPQIITITQPAESIATLVVETSDTDSEDTASESRSQSLLSRERGRFGTIQTGFRGLLGATDPSTARKTLLGE